MQAPSSKLLRLDLTEGVTGKPVLHETGTKRLGGCTTKSCIRVSRGQDPERRQAGLPVEQPTKFEFVINLKAARQIGLTISK